MEALDYFCLTKFKKTNCIKENMFAKKLNYPKREMHKIVRIYWCLYYLFPYGKSNVKTWFVNVLLYNNMCEYTKCKMTPNLF